MSMSTDPRQRYPSETWEQDAVAAMTPTNGVACDRPPPALSAPRGLAGLFDKQAKIAYEPLDVASLPSNTVLVNVYNVSDMELFQKINQYTTVNDNVLIGGVFHAGVEVYGREWSYGFTETDETGVAFCGPRSHTQHTYRATVQMGPTSVTEQELLDLIQLLKQRWRGIEYNLIHHNCCDFANDLCKELGVGRMPGWIDRLGRTASSLDNASKRVAEGYRNGKQLARTVSAEIAPHVEQVIEVAQPKFQEAAQGVCRWGRDLFSAAAKALGDLQTQQAASQQRERPAGSRNARGQRTNAISKHTAETDGSSSPDGSLDIRNALRNRGGVSVQRPQPSEMSSAAMGGSAENRYGEELLLESVDAFLLEGLPLEEIRGPSAANNAPNGDLAKPIQFAMDSGPGLQPPNAPIDSVAGQPDGVRSDEPIGASDGRAIQPVPPTAAVAEVAEGSAATIE